MTANASSTTNSTISYNWSSNADLDCYDCETTSTTVTENSTYQVVVSDENACTASAEASATAFVVNEIAIPNAFSPNDDGTNDTFGIWGSNIESIDLHIYNRWGVEVFSYTGSDLTQRWDGTYKGRMQDIGVFVYYVTITFTDKSTEFEQGNVSLVR